MALVGDLGSVDLAQVFQVLAQNQKDGVLEVFRGGEHRGLRFRRGTVTMQFDRDLYEERAIEILSLLGKVSQEKLQLAAANRAGSEAALIEVLVQMKILSDADVVTLFRERMAEELYDLFAWTDGHFEFHEGKARLDAVAGDLDDRLCFPTEGVVFEAARRLDEWSRIRSIIPDDNEVFVPTVKELAPEDDLQATVFVEVNGTRSVEDIKRKLGRSRFEVTKCLARLFEMGSIRALTPEEYPTRGQAAMKAGHPREAANLFDRAVEFQADIPASFGAAGQAWEATGDRAVAVERYVAFADQLLERQRFEEAFKAYKRAHQTIPTHLAAWKRLAMLAFDLQEIHPSGRADLDSEETGAQKLAAVLFEIGLEADGVEVLERLIQREPKNLDAKRALVQALDGAGNSERLCELLESVAVDLNDRGDTVAAAASLQRALRLQPQRRDLSARIRELYRRDERRRGRVKLMTGLAVSAVLLAGVGALAYSREERARADLESIDIDGAIAEGEFDRARLLLEDFTNNHPFTLALRDVDALSAKVDGAVAKAQIQEAQRKSEEMAARRKRQDEAMRLAARADNDARGGKLGDALAGLRKALAVAPPDWELAPTVLTNAEELEAYLTGASQISARAKQQIEAKNYAGARDSIRDLLAKYPRSPEGLVAKYPVLVKTVPPGAEIRVDGGAAELGDIGALRTPAIVYLEPSKKPRSLALRLDGFETATLLTDPARDASVEALLGRAADSTVELSHGATGFVSMAGSRVFVSLVGGRLAAFDGGPDPAWTHGFSSGGDIAFAPLVADDWVFLGTTDGAVACVAAADGVVRWRIDLAAALGVPFLLRPEGLVVASGDGKIRILDPATGDKRQEWRPSVKPAGGMVYANNLLYVGTADGRIRILEIGNPRAEDKSLAFGAPVAGLVLADDTIVASGDDGRLVGFDLATGRSLWETPGGRINPSKPVLGKGRVYVERDGRLVALEPRTGNVTATAPATIEPSGSLALAGGIVLASLRDGTAVALRENDLTEIWRWAGAAGGSLGFPTAPKDARIPTVGAAGTSGVAVAGKQLFRFDLARNPVSGTDSPGVSSRPSSPASPNADSKNR